LKKTGLAGDTDQLQFDAVAAGRQPETIKAETSYV
jgi:hypothetical protein